MTEETLEYRLVFSGEVTEGQHPAVVKKRLATVLKLDDERPQLRSHERDRRSLRPQRAPRPPRERAEQRQAEERAAGDARALAEVDDGGVRGEHRQRAVLREIREPDGARRAW